MPCQALRASNLEDFTGSSSFIPSKGKTIHLWSTQLRIYTVIPLPLVACEVVRTGLRWFGKSSEPGYGLHSL